MTPSGHIREEQAAEILSHRLLKVKDKFNKRYKMIKMGLEPFKFPEETGIWFLKSEVEALAVQEPYRVFNKYHGRVTTTTKQLAR